LGAARANGARIVLPGTVYNFGPDAFPDLRETSPQNPVTAKGRIRASARRSPSRHRRHEQILISRVYNRPKEPKLRPGERKSPSVRAVAPPIHKVTSMGWPFLRETPPNGMGLE
jgi:hypothetical protein